MVAEGTSPFRGRFRGSQTNRLDAKKRVAIPASFRTVLNGQPMVLRPSLDEACIEAWPMALIEAEALEVSSSARLSAEERQRLRWQMTLAQDVMPDAEGRIVLDAALIAHAGISDLVAFQGMGRFFELWEPGAAVQQAVATERARGGT
jgi:MraZ protein